MSRITAIILIGIIMLLTIRLCSVCGENRTLELDNENLQTQVYELAGIANGRNDYEIGVG
jgi:hypothetical protein